MPTDTNETMSARRPGRPKLSESERAQVRERLLDAATELAVEQGFDACGLREIAARADVSPGMIAYYFGDRAGLYRAMFQRIFDQVTEQARAILGDLSDPERSAEDRIGALVRMEVTTLAANPWLPTLIMREVLSRNDSPLREYFIESIGSGMLPIMLDWIREEQARGRISQDFDARLLAVTIASLTGFPFLILPVIGEQIGLTIDDEFPDRLIAYNQRLLAHGIRARPEEER